MSGWRARTSIGDAVLEGHFELIVGNARHIRNVPGRKTDVKGFRSRSPIWSGTI